MIEIRVTKDVGIDLVNLKSGNDLINLLTRVILLIKLSNNINKIEILLILCDKAFC